MAIIRIADISHVSFRAPDLSLMRSFLEDFGLQAVGTEPERLFMRGAGSAAFVHVTEPGDAGLAAIGFRAQSLEDLARLAATTGAAVEPLDAPGGGQVARLADPDGNVVEVVAGQAAAEATICAPRPPWNEAAARRRRSASVRLSPGPARVLRLGHVVLNVADFRASEAWYKHHFGFITSDEIAVSAEVSIGAFLRCDRGEEPTDHHTLFLVQSPKGPGFNHAAFEVQDLDDLMRGHDHLARAGRQPEWGVGRHILGSQIFDYWRDPWGHVLEHWTDGDLLTSADGSRTTGLADLLGVQWGARAPATMG